MGMEQRVSFAGAAAPAWEAVRDLLAGRGFPVQLRMIDGELSFPEDVPPDGWRELRVGTPQGMVTVRREDGGVALMTWGNADLGRSRPPRAPSLPLPSPPAPSCPTPCGPDGPSLLAVSRRPFSDHREASGRRPCLEPAGGNRV